MATNPEYDPDEVVYLQPATRPQQVLAPRRAAPSLVPQQRPDIRIRREGPLGLGIFENRQDRRHLDRIIRYEQKYVEARVAERLAHLADVVGYKELIERTEQVVGLLSETMPNTTTGQVAEDAASRTIARMVVRRDAIQDLLDSELQNTFASG
jgi:hypothetical protein